MLATILPLFPLPLEGPLFPEETPWWAVWWYWVLIPLIGGIPATVAVLITRSNHKKELADTKALVQKVDEQVSNSHETNLRHDMDATKKVADEAKTEAQLARQSSDRTELLTRDLLKSVAAIQHSLERRDGIQTEQLREMSRDLKDHIDAVTPTLEEWFDNHNATCPALASFRASRKTH